MKISSLATYAGGFAAFAGLYLLLNDHSTNATYRGIWLLPLTFVVIVLVMSGARKFGSGQFGLTFTFLATLFFVRLVVTPLAIHFAGPDYRALSYLSVTPDEMLNAILLIAWESIAAALFFFVAAGAIASRRPVAEPAGQRIALQGSQVVYGAVALLGVMMIVSIGLPRGLLNFGSIGAEGIADEKTSVDMLLIQIMIAGAWLMYLLTLNRQALRYRRHPARIPFFIALATGTFLLMLIFGDRRSIQVYTAIAVATTLFAAFPDRKRAIVFYIAIAAVTVIATISFWRLFARHDIDLTTTTLLGQSFMATMATTLQSYSGGPYQVAAANSVLLNKGVGLENVLFDFLRSTFIVNFFVDDSSMMTSQILNNDIYNGNFLTGWLVFTTSYGATTLGAFFMPLFLFLNVSIAMLCERVFRRARGLEVRFLFVYLFARMAFSPFVATPLLISFFTIQLFTIGLIFYAAILLKTLDRPSVKTIRAV